MKKVKVILFLTILLIVSCGLIYTANLFTEKVIESNFLKQEYSDIIDAGLVFETIDKVSLDEMEEGIIDVYRGKNNEGTTCLAFFVVNYNQYAKMSMIIIVEEATERVLNIHILNDDGHNYDDYFHGSTFGMLNTPISDVEKNFQIVSHATVSSTSVKNCLIQVNKQLSSIGGKIVFQELKQILPNHLNFEYTFSKDGENVVLLLKYIEGTKTFEYLETISDSNLNEEEIGMLINVANVNLPKNWIRNVSIEADGTKLTIVTNKGFKGEIVADVKINNRKITLFELKVFNETYDKNPNYTLDGDLKDYLLSKYQLGIKGEIVTGATVTSKAINYILSLVDDYIASLDGGK